LLTLLINDKHVPDIQRPHKIAIAAAEQRVVWMAHDHFHIVAVATLKRSKNIINAFNPSVAYAAMLFIGTCLL
jgi:hypothetical protein